MGVTDFTACVMYKWTKVITVIVRAWRREHGSRDQKL